MKRALILNLSLPILMTWFTTEIFSGIPSTGFIILLIFVGWNMAFWLLSFFYSKETFFKTPKIIILMLFYLKELVVASLRVAFEVLSFRDHMYPAIIALPLDAKTDMEITLLANIITLTPGTLSIDVSEDRKTLYVHAMYVQKDDINEFKKQLKEGFERRILEITRSQSQV